MNPRIEKPIIFWHSPEDRPETNIALLLCIENTSEYGSLYTVYIQGMFDVGECLGEYEEYWCYQEPNNNCLTELSDNQKVVKWAYLKEVSEC